MLSCSPDRPWGIHLRLHSDEDCPRCGWTAPGPKGDALADALADALYAAKVEEMAAELGWTVIKDDPARKLAA
jgi:hypothetical protein